MRRQEAVHIHQHLVEAVRIHFVVDSWVVVVVGTRVVVAAVHIHFVVGTRVVVAAVHIHFVVGTLVVAEMGRIHSVVGGTLDFQVGVRTPLVVVAVVCTLYWGSLDCSMLLSPAPPLPWNLECQNQHLNIIDLIALMITHKCVITIVRTRINRNE